MWIAALREGNSEEQGSALRFRSWEGCRWEERIRKGNVTWGRVGNGAREEETLLHSLPLLLGNHQNLLGLWFQLALRCYLGFRAEKAMAPHSSTLAWKIPWTEKSGGLQSMGSQRVGHDWTTSLSLFTFTHWRRKWQPTPLILPGESQGQGSLVGCHLWSCPESDTTEAT